MPSPVPFSQSIWHKYPIQPQLKLQILILENRELSTPNPFSPTWHPPPSLHDNLLPPCIVSSSSLSHCTKPIPSLHDSHLHLCMTLQILILENRELPKPNPFSPTWHPPLLLHNNLPPTYIVSSSSLHYIHHIPAWQSSLHACHLCSLHGIPFHPWMASPPLPAWHPYLYLSLHGGWWTSL